MITKPYIRFLVATVLFCLFSGFTQANATDTQTLNIGWLLESARNMILTSDPWAGQGCEVDINGTPSDIIVYESGHISVSAVLERNPNSLRDVGAVTVEVYIDGELYMRFDPSPYLLVTVPVFTACHDIDRGQVLSSLDFTETPTDVRSLPSDEMYDTVEDIIGMAARMNIQSGRIITTSMLEPPTMVVRGEAVVVYIDLGNAFVTLHGTALDSGAVGDQIRVRNTDSNVIITATVTGASLAQIFIL
jgi:flagella basal body P-ring formation protein FlgA